MKDRKVQTYKNICTDGRSWHLEENEIGFFLGFGCDYEELTSGIGNFSTAIVELENGTIENLPLHLVRFIDPKSVTSPI